MRNTVRNSLRFLCWVGIKIYVDLKLFEKNSNKTTKKCNKMWMQKKKKKGSCSSILVFSFKYTVVSAIWKCRFQVYSLIFNPARKPFCLVPLCWLLYTQLSRRLMKLKFNSHSLWIRCKTGEWSGCYLQLTSVLVCSFTVFFCEECFSVTRIS